VQLVGSLPFVIYIATQAGTENILPDRFLYTGNDLTILRIPVPKGKQPEIIIAKESIKYNIWSSNYDRGMAIANISYTEKILHLNMLIFYSLDTSGQLEMSCGGVEEMISLPSKGAIQSVTCSTVYPSG